MATRNAQVVLHSLGFLTGLQFYANDAAFVTAKGSAASAGDLYNNTTDGTVHWYDSVAGAWRTAVSTSATQTLTNKTLETPVLNGLRRAYVLKNSSSVTSYTVLSTDYEVSGNTDTAAQTFTLPAATTVGQEFEFHYAGTGYANAITINNSGGGANTTLNTPGERVCLRSNGTAFVTVWRRVGDLAAWTATTVTCGLTGGTNTVTAYQRRVGDTLEVWLDALFNPVFTGGSATFTLPNSLTMDTAKIPGTVTGGTTPLLGAVRHLDVGTDNYAGDVYYSSSTAVVARVMVEDAGASSNHIACANSISTTVPMTWANSDRMHVRFSCPITGWKG